MRLTAPRIQPLTPEEWNEDARAALAPVTNPDGETFNIFATFAHNPKALAAFLPWGGYVLRQTDLPPRERELIILRVGHNCNSGYEIAQHENIGKQCGLSDADIAALSQPNDQYDWAENEALLIKAADQLGRDHHINDALWAALSQHYTTNQLMDIVFVIGQYTQVSMALNCFGVQLEKKA